MKGAVEKGADLFSLSPSTAGFALTASYFLFARVKEKASSLEVTRGKGFAVFHPTLRQRRCVGGVSG